MRAEDIIYQHYNERDIEIPTLLEDLKKLQPSSFLDVGAHYSWYHYAQQVRDVLPDARYHAVDILSDDKTAAIADKFFRGNVLDLEIPCANFVCCLSTIEHCGLSTYQLEDFRAEQDRVFQRIIALSDPYAFLSFPFGQDNVYPGEYANITDNQLSRWQECVWMAGRKYQCEFWYNEFPQGKLLWDQCSRHEAASVPMRKNRGTQCICMMKIGAG